MKCRITPLENGPLKLESDGLSLHKGQETIAADQTAMLCACGRSGTKPFCDGAHIAAGFRSERRIDQEKIQVYAGEAVTVRFNRSICSGAGRCVRGLPAVFRSGDSSNWIFPDEAARDRVIAQVEACPSGALSWEAADQDAESNEMTCEAKVTIVPDGPYHLEGIELLGVERPTGGDAGRFSLCRCGHSANKPFCDYSHGEKGWREDGSGADS